MSTGIYWDCMGKVFVLHFPRAVAKHKFPFTFISGVLVFYNPSGFAKWTHLILWPVDLQWLMYDSSSFVLNFSIMQSASVSKRFPSVTIITVPATCNCLVHSFRHERTVESVLVRHGEQKDLIRRVKVCLFIIIPFSWLGHFSRCMLKHAKH